MLGDKGLQVAVDVEDEINELQKEVHARIIREQALKSGGDLPTDPGFRAPPHPRTPR